MNPIDLYISEAPLEHREPLAKIRDILKKTLIPLGYEECVSYKMIGYVVPFSLYPCGYHCDTELPLPFVNLASRKSGISLYHMGIGANPDLLQWWQEKYTKCNIGKLDMGVGCIRFKKLDQIPYDLIDELMQKISPKEWIELYEKMYRNN